MRQAATGLLRTMALCVCFAVSAPAAETRPRLISLAPSLTEAVFAIGAGDCLVGVTSHCRYPPAATAIAKIGDYQTPNIETIFVMRPDAVLALEEHSPSFPTFDALGIIYEVFDHRSLPGVLDSLTRLGELSGERERAAALRDEIAQALEPPPDGTEAAPSVLFLIGRDYGQGGIANAYAVGNDDLYSRVIRAAGCRNAYTGDAPYPVLSGEGVAALDPDIIVEALYGEMGTGLSRETVMADWSALANLRAVKNSRIYQIRSDYVFVPGARLVLLKHDLADCLRRSGLAHPVAP